MSDYKIKYSNEAVCDLKAIYQYIALDCLEPGNAAMLIKAIQDSILLLRQLPFRYPLLDWLPWKDLGLRRMGIKNHIVFYRADEKKSLHLCISNTELSPRC